MVSLLLADGEHADTLQERQRSKFIRCGFFCRDNHHCRVFLHNVGDGCGFILEGAPWRIIMARKSHFALAPSSDEAAPRLTPRALTKQEFGRRLYQMILDRGWNQSDLGRAAGIGRDSVSNYINGHAFPTPLALQKLATALNIDQGELLPNALMNAMDDEHPALELRMAAGHTGKAWLRVNQLLPLDVATKIINLINGIEGQKEAAR